MRVRLGGGDATFADSVRAANQRMGHITKWALIVTSVGVLLHVIESACERLGGIGSLILRALAALMVFSGFVGGLIAKFGAAIFGGH